MACPALPSADFGSRLRRFPRVFLRGLAVDFVPVHEFDRRRHDPRAPRPQAGFLALPAAVLRFARQWAEILLLPRLGFYHQPVSLVTARLVNHRPTEALVFVVELDADDAFTHAG